MQPSSSRQESGLEQTHVLAHRLLQTNAFLWFTTTRVSHCISMKYLSEICWNNEAPGRDPIPAPRSSTASCKPAGGEMGFHLQHGPPATVHRMLGLFNLAAPPLPSAGDDAACSLQSGLVQEVVEGQGTSRLARALTRLGVPVPRPPSDPSCASPAALGAAHGVWDPALAVHTPTPCSELAPSTAGPVYVGHPPLQSGSAASALPFVLHGPSASGKQGAGDARPGCCLYQLHCYRRAGQQENLVHVQD